MTGNSTLLSSIADEGAMLTVCPGELVSLTCSHDNTAGELTKWIISGAMSCIGLVSHTAGFTEDTCGDFNIIMISDNTGPTVSSTIQILATEALNGILIECFAGGHSSSPLVGNTSLNVIGESYYTTAFQKISSSTATDLNVPIVTDWMASLRTNSLYPVLEWDPLDQPYQRCVTGFTVNLNGTKYNTTNTSLSLARESLPYCDTLTVTVTPLTLNGPLSPDTSNLTLISPGMCVMCVMCVM